MAGQTIDNDIASLTVGKIMNLDPCGLYKHSPKARTGIRHKFIEEFFHFVRVEREMPIEIREMACNMTNAELDYALEWLADGLSALLGEKRRRG